MMDRQEAYALAHRELAVIEASGYGSAVGHIDTTHLKVVSAPSSTTYEVEISYLWEDREHESVLVICRVTSKHWFTHEQLEESIVLCEDASQ